MILGARQVGKTYILKEFCRNNYNNFVYINLEQNQEVVSIFEKTLRPEEIISQIRLMLDVSINPEDTVIFFDEIQISEKAITALKYFEESNIKYSMCW